MKRMGRISMDRCVQVLTMRRAGHGINKIATALKMCKKTVKRLLETQVGTGVIQPELEVKPAPGIEPVLPDWLKALDSDFLIKEVRKGVPYQVLFQEQKGISVSYWTFWNTLSKLSKVEKDPVTTMRLRHNPGEKTFVDYTDGLGVATI